MTGPSVGTPEASVIIACHNATRTLPLQLEALSRQEGAPAFEVILSDNGSDDDLVGLADEWAERLDVRYVWSGQMPGAAYARNVGMSIARADKWLFCDADDVVAPDWVACGALMLDAVPVFSGGAGRAGDSEMDASLDEIWSRFGPSRKDDPVRPARQPAHWPIIMGGNFGVRRRMALEIGGFDASLTRGVEDNDLAVRLEKAGTLVSGGSTRILYRERDDPADVLRSSFVSGQWHMALVERHGLADRSPQLRGRRWMADPLRVAGTALKNLGGGGAGDWPAVASRAGLAAGLWSGWARYCVGDGLPAPLIGAGLGGREPELPAGAAALVLSAHLDDALFSCAELIRRTRPDVWTVFAGDPEPAVTTTWDRSCGYPDSHTLVTRRREEDLAAFEGTGATVTHLDMLDGAYTTAGRRTDDLARLADAVRGWVEKHRDEEPVIVLPACAGTVVAPGLMDSLAPLVTTLCRPTKETAGLATATTVTAAANGCVSDGSGASGEHSASAVGWAVARLKRLKHRLYQRRRAQAQQLGLAANGDHVAVRDAVLDVLAGLRADCDEPVKVLLAEDLPYLWSHPGDDEVQRLADRREVSAEPREFHVDRGWKFERISHYTSQLDVMDPVHHRFNRSETIPPVERCWELVGL